MDITTLVLRLGVELVNVEAKTTIENSERILVKKKVDEVWFWTTRLNANDLINEKIAEIIKRT